MHAWLFRHRDRLRVILGLPDPRRSPGPCASPPPGRAARGLAQAAGRGPGEVERRGREVVVVPMPRRA